MNKFYFFLFLISFFTQNAATQNWVRQNPHPLLSDLKDIYVDTEGFGWAVGQQNALLKTSDGGLTWSIEDSGVSDWDFNGIIYLPNSMGLKWIATADQGMLRSDDNGLTWNQIETDIMDIKSHQLINDQIIYVLNKSSIGKSIDGGITWSILDGIDGNHGGMSFANANNGWVFSTNEDKIYMTTDGGITWDEQISNIEIDRGSLDLIHFIDANTGYISVKGDFYKTVDGGLTWDLKWDENFTVTNLSLVITMTGRLITIRDFGTIYYSDDDGSSWSKANNQLHPGRSSGQLRIGGDNKIWALNQYTSILLSTDNGSNFQDQLAGYKDQLRDIDMYDENFGIAAGSANSVLVTENSGASWVNHVVEENLSTIWDVLAVSQNEYWVAATGGIYQSTDQGETWELKFEAGGGNTGIAQLNDDVFVFSNAFKEIFRSEDHGETWIKTLERVTGTENISDLFFFNDQLGWAVGNNSYFIKTIDGGLTWAIASNPNSDIEPYRDVHFTSETEGWLVTNTKLFYTNDGGITWEDKTIQSLRPFVITFFDELNGYHIGSKSGNSEVYKTSDGGQTWTLNRTSETSITAIDLDVDSEKRWICGTGGNIEVSAGCGNLPVTNPIVAPESACPGDTIAINVETENIILFNWDLPETWSIVGNTNTNSINVLLGNQNGLITFSGSNGCDNSPSISSEIMLTPNFDQVEINRTGNQLSVSVVADHYQWYLNNILIVDATSSTYDFTVSGTYLVEVQKGNCNTVFSNPLNAVVTSTYDLSESDWTMMPNPAYNYITFNNSAVNQDPTIMHIYNLNGSKINSYQISNNEQIDLSQLSPNIYMIQLIENNKIYTGKLVIIE